MSSASYKRHGGQLFCDVLKGCRLQYGKRKLRMASLPENFLLNLSNQMNQMVRIHIIKTNSQPCLLESSQRCWPPVKDGFVFMLHQNSGGIEKSIPDAREISWDLRDFPRESPREILRFEGNVEVQGKCQGLRKISRVEGIRHLKWVLLAKGPIFGRPHLVVRGALLHQIRSFF